MKGSNFFSLLVVGDNPKEMVEPYNVANNVETYVKYKFDDAAKLKKVAIKVTEKILDAKNEVQLSDMVSEYLEDRLNALKHMTDFEYYSSLTMGMEYDENGNRDIEREEKKNRVFNNVKAQFEDLVNNEEGPLVYLIRR